MRRLSKGTKPQVLVAHDSEWNAWYVAERHAGRNPRGKWGHEEIRESLHGESEGLCAYCESIVTHVAYEHVEHIRPKSKFPELSHEWSNLTNACPRCNQNKSDTWFDGEHRLLDPYNDDPTEHLEFVGPLVFARDTSTHGEMTREHIKLDRGDLTNSRTKRLNSLFPLVQRWQSAEEPLKSTLAMAIREDCNHGEYPTCVAAFLEHLGLGPV